MSENRRAKTLESMADLLRRGATLTNLACPACASPLFRLKTGELWCAKCQKQVVVMKEGETPLQATSPLLLTSLENTLLTKIKEVENTLKIETDPEKLEKLSQILSNLLENLEKVKKMKSET